MKKRKLLLAGLGVILAVGGLIGCGSTPTPSATKNTPASDSSNETVTLQMVWTGAKTQADENMSNPVIKQKFPNVTFEYHQVEDLDKLVAAGVKPDFINVNDPYLPILQDMGLLGDLSGLLKQQNYDLSKFPSGWIDKLKKYSTKGELYAVPSTVPTNVKETTTPYVLAYNKTIFDKFAVPYPKDKMTWDEVIELAKRFNRTEGGIQYRGLQIQNYADVMLTANNPKYIDSNGNVDLSDPKWTDHLRIIKAAYDANGGWLPFPGQVQDWAKQGNIAMFAGHAGSLILHPDAFPNFDNWDLATYPSFRKGELAAPDQLGIYVIPAVSQHKELMLSIIKAMQSPEYVSNNPDLWKNPILLTKNAKAYKNIPSSMYIASKWDSRATSVLRKDITAFLTSGTDINTTLRDMQKDITNQISQNNSK